MAATTDHLKRAEQPISFLIFAVVRRTPLNVEEYNSIKSVQTQMTAARRFCNKWMFKISYLQRGFSTNAKTRIDRSEHYKAALADARLHQCPVLIGDVFAALRNLNPTVAFEVWMALRAFELPMYDAITGEHVQAMAPDMFASLIAAEMKARSPRSAAIKKGLQAGETRRQKRVDKPRIRLLTTRVAAKRLRPLLEEIEALLQPETLTASILARELNARGERASRGGPWSRSSAMRLLNEFQTLSRQ